MSLTIKKVVDLSSLGEDYNGIELVFKSIPARDLPELNKKQEAFPKGKDGTPNLDKVLPFFIETLQKYFLGGTQDKEKVSKEDIGELDSNALIYCFQIITGQDIDPKVESESPSTSTTESETAQKSENTSTDDSST